MGRRRLADERRVSAVFLVFLNRATTASTAVVPAARSPPPHRKEFTRLNRSPARVAGATQNRS